MFAGAFDPRRLGLALWLSDTGSDPSQWDDLSGNGRNATQATPANQPAIISAGLNGRQVRRFDGSNDWLSFVAGSIGQNASGVTIIAVYKWASNPAATKVITNITVGTNNNTRAGLLGGL